MDVYSCFVFMCRARLIGQNSHNNAGYSNYDQLIFKRVGACVILVNDVSFLQSIMCERNWLLRPIYRLSSHVNQIVIKLPIFTP